MGRERFSVRVSLSLLRLSLSTPQFHLFCHSVFSYSCLSISYWGLCITGTISVIAKASRGLQDDMYPHLEIKTLCISESDNDRI